MEEIQYIEQLLQDVSGYVSEQYGQRKNLSVYTKANANDFLTEVDITVQGILVNKIRKTYSSDLILAEESGLDKIPSLGNDRCWIIDPIDGTQNFLRGLFPEFGISIGVMKNGILHAGGVLFPVSGDMFLTEKGSGAFRNGKRMKVSSTDVLSHARIDIDLGGLDNRDVNLHRAKSIAQQAGQVRSYGCSVMGFCQVADGQQDAYIAFSVKPWDVAAGMLLVEEAGGKVSSFTGETVSPFESHKIGIVSNGVIHSRCMGCF
ncbi:inositol monophosphatase family protein [Sphaerochaeta sp. PS]|uniref:inositol monophosphatase family protein n=1 Tax=Sphaerochaeta sp. PS TaxID=3076336 RepID=UPI0028A57E57|nr:inositol monophosphatase family protein [Sphaerochaeta sp. PS]MDT4763185.1 inositol monophosphatase family protein [Sphaerochaeta sp. PS]